MSTISLTTHGCTGTRHELSFQDRDPHDVYIGKEFTKDEMLDRCDGLFDGPEYWMNLLTLQEEFELLTQAGTTWS